MILRVDAYHASYRLSLYTPFWVLNRTDLKLEFQVNEIFFRWILIGLFNRLNQFEQ